MQMSEHQFARHALIGSLLLLAIGPYTQKVFGHADADSTGSQAKGQYVSAAAPTDRESDLQRQVARRARERDIALVAAVVALGAMLLYRRRADRARVAEELSLLDPLTGLHNRRYLDQVIALDVATSTRRHRDAAAMGLAPVDADLTFFMIDLDDFKAVNDTYGHAIGDHVLRSVGRVLRAVSRESDVVVRWGGDEFLVVGRFSDRVLAGATAERIRAAVRAHVMDLPGDTARCLSCSIGFVAFPFDPVRREAMSWDRLLFLADLAAFDAKHAGGNCWIGYASAGWTPGPDERISRHDVNNWIASGRITRLHRAGDERTALAVERAEVPRLHLM